MSVELFRPDGGEVPSGRFRINIPPGSRARLWALDGLGFPTGEPIEVVLAGGGLDAKIEGETMHPGAPRDVNLDEWLNRIAHHAPGDERTKLAHQAVRQAVAEVGRILHGLLPPGQDKSLVFTHLKDALMYANSAVAVGGGPHAWMDDDTLRRLAAHGPLVAEQRGEDLPAGLREDETDASVTLESPAEPTETYREEVRGSAGEIVFQVAGNLLPGGGYVDLAVVCTDPGLVAEVVKVHRFDGFHRTLDTAEQVQHAVNAILQAADRAGLGHVESPIK